MKISCKIIQDLLPLYYDQVCSEDSVKIIEEHLENCNDCSDYLEELNIDTFEKNIILNTENSKVDSFKKLNKELFKKKLKIALLSIISVILVYMIAYPLIFRFEIPISYKDDLVEIKEIEDNKIKLSFIGKDFYSFSFFKDKVEIEGEEKTIFLIYYTNTIWSKLSPKQQFISNTSTYFYSGSQINGRTIKFWEDIILEDDVDEIYYLIYNYDKLWDESADDYLEKATLLWEK